MQYVSADVSVCPSLFCGVFRHRPPCRRQPVRDKASLRNKGIKRGAVNVAAPGEVMEEEWRASERLCLHGPIRATALRNTIRHRTLWRSSNGWVTNRVYGTPTSGPTPTSFHIIR